MDSIGIFINDPGKTGLSYTRNWPHAPLAGNTPMAGTGKKLGMVPLAGGKPQPALVSASVAKRA